jgi:hypothetical protein
MLSSPRSPYTTMRIFSSAEKCRRVARRMSLIASPAGVTFRPGFLFTSLPTATMIQKPRYLKTRAVSKALTADTELSNNESSIHFPATPKMMDDRAVAMLTASSRS